MLAYEYKARVYYEDTDAGGVVYHARYLCFYERARTEILREIGISQQVLLTEGIAFVVKNMEISYNQAARLDDLLTIKSTITKIKKASIIFNQSLYNEKQELINTSKFVIACVDIINMKPCGLPKTLLTELI